MARLRDESFFTELFALPPWVVMVLALVALVGTGVNMYTICSMFLCPLGCCNKVACWLADPCLLPGCTFCISVRYLATQDCTHWKLGEASFTDEGLHH